MSPLMNNTKNLKTEQGKFGVQLDVGNIFQLYVYEVYLHASCEAILQFFKKISTRVIIRFVA